LTESNKPNDALQAWIFLAFMNVHIPILRAALDAYLKKGKVPRKYHDACMILNFILAAAQQRLEEGESDDYGR